MFRIILVVFFYALLATGTPGAHAAVAPSTPSKTSSETAESPGTPDAVTHHAITIDGKTYAYTARAGTITLHNDKNQATANIFYTADTLDSADPDTRPVTFFYNGGPGSSTMWLRMGAFGPVRVQLANGKVEPLPPYHLVDNPSTLLDKSDLVFIDMPNSGFGRITGAGKPKDFFSVDGDAQAFEQFIRRYIGTFHRWNSPKFLFGESYGTTRSAVLVNDLQNDGIAINGVVLLSSILNYQLMGDRIAGGDWKYVFYLPTLAATAWYHHTAPYHPASLAALLPEVEQFASTEYLLALEQGSALPHGEFETIVAKLHRYTGLSPQYIRNSNLRVSYGRFENELLRNSGKTFGRYDTRYETYVLDRPKETPDWDATLSAVCAPLTAATEEYLRDDLHYETSLEYWGFTDVGDWDFKHNKEPLVNAAPDLAQALTQNPRLRVFSANGRFDFATPYFATVYTLRHLNLEPALQSHITFGFYESGHMVYLNADALAQLKQDLARWYDDTLASH